MFGSVCEPLGVGRGGTVSRMRNRSGRNGMRGRSYLADLVCGAGCPTSTGGEGISGG